MYCLRCKKHTTTDNPATRVAKNGRVQQYGNCNVCLSRKCTFVKSGGAVKRPVWTDELAEEMHKPIRHKFKKRRVYSPGIDKIWAADLVDMSSHDIAKLIMV